MTMSLSKRITALASGKETDPFSVLGPQTEDSVAVARAFLPDAKAVAVYKLDRKTKLGTLKKIHDAGVFDGKIKSADGQPIAYKVTYVGGDDWVVDPYSFGPVLGPLDDYYMAEGSHLRLFDKLGAHVMEHEGVHGVHFAVWAPNAHRVSLVCDQNAWDGRRHVMRNRRDPGVWEIFMPGMQPGVAYKYEIIGSDGKKLPLKADPMAFQAELRPSTASVVAAPSRHEWSDQAHRDFWANTEARRQPISVYEVHPGSWRRDADNNFLHWDALGEQLIPYVVEMGFTHIEFLPIMEHPYDPSWGYQVTGMFAPSARFGEPDGFARFVEGAHKAGIGVILDWVPAHFPMDDHGLNRFDGTALYEYEDPRKGYHPDWKTSIYNFKRREVEAFLVNNALYWTEKYHVDGLRVDAVASMLYLDYSRKDGEWEPNEHGGRENLDAVGFLKRLNTDFYSQHRGPFTIAEESTSWPKVSSPVHDGGLGFGFKWNLGFMHDTLQYLAREPVHRSHHHDEILFGLIYAFSENFVLPLSHDEVVHGKGSLLHKMPGPDDEKFATLRAYYAFMWGYPGKKLLFMGQEFAQRAEWSEERALDWHLTDQSSHAGVQFLVRDLNHLYRDRPALHVGDCSGEDFAWVQKDARDECIFAWLRVCEGHAPIVVISHFTPVNRAAHRIRLPKPGVWREILNTDAVQYGGSGEGNMGSVTTDDEGWATIVAPPLSTLMLEFVE